MWNDLAELLNTMESATKQANQIYDLVMASSDNKWGPSDTKTRLLNEMEDLLSLMSVSLLLSSLVL